MDLAADQSPFLQLKPDLNSTFANNGTFTNDNSKMPLTMMDSIMANLPDVIKQLEPMLYNPYLLGSVNWFFFGWLFDFARRIWQWTLDRFTAGFILTAIFDSGDPAYDWFAAYLSEQNIWGSTREFRVSARSSARSWGVTSNGDDENEEPGHASYSPMMGMTQVFWFNGTFCQIRRSHGGGGGGGFGMASPPGGGLHEAHYDGGQLILVMYTRKRQVLDELVETAFSRYKHKTKEKPMLTIHNTCTCGQWCGTSSKSRRPIDTLILPKGVKERLLRDAKEFIRSHSWYVDAGIQHKRGYLLYGLPGTGKSSTIHALASELGLEIYTLSLSTARLDDTGLARLISTTPSNSMILIEDIDCAFPSREKSKRAKLQQMQACNNGFGDPWGMPPPTVTSSITLSGLLNVLDGVTSEEGRMVFATTNYIEKLDPALMRPGRMDVRLHYSRSTRYQIIKLYKRFFMISDRNPKADNNKGDVSATTAGATTNEKKPEELTPPPTPPSSTKTPRRLDIDDDDDDDDDDNCDFEFEIDNPIYPPSLPKETVDQLARQFADKIPVNKYSMAELEGYLVTVRTKPDAAVEGVERWMKETEEERERIKQREREEEEELKKEAEELDKLMKGDKDSSYRERAMMTDTAS